MRRGQCGRHAVTGSASVVVLIVLALGLCGLCAFQWVRETRLRGRVDGLQAERQVLAEEKAAAEAQAKRFQEEIRRVERERIELRASSETNALTNQRLRLELQKVVLEAEQAKRTADSYKAAFDKANASIREQNEAVAKLKSDYVKLAEDRNAQVNRYNELARQQTSLVKRFDDLVQKWNALQEQIKAAPANPDPAVKPSKEKTK
jgi:chromosome segregation ATPase